MTPGTKMQQVIQHPGSGLTEVAAVPAPALFASEVLVAVAASAISAGTEHYVVDLSRKSLLGKARQRPADVKRVLQKIRNEGLRTTLAQVSAKLDQPIPLGYSAAGVVVECGADVEEFKPGDRVAAVAPHAALSAVGRNLCAAIPDGVSFEAAAYSSIAAIGLQGVRLARVGLGDSVAVVGLGLIGQICVCLLKAQGCRVFGVDIDPARLELAVALGADQVGLGTPLDAVRAFSGGHGLDAVLLTAATDSNQPIEFAADACRQKGRIVLVGVVGLNVPRPPFFQKELEFTVSYSLGPGRGDPGYEEQGRDYPIGYARWTVQRNLQAVLELMRAGKLPVERLTTHRFAIERAADAYDLILTRREPHLGLVLEYGPVPEAARRQPLAPATAPSARRGGAGISLIGTGNFARLVMLPALAKLPGTRMRGVCAAHGMNAAHTGKRHGFAFAATDADEIWRDAETDAVFIATRHNLHAELVLAALRAGKHVYVEKPLCLRADELAAIAASVAELGERCPIVLAGFNRRFAPAVGHVREFFAGAGALAISHRFAVPDLPPEHWTLDPEIGGGRILGEACHAIDTCTALAGSPPVAVQAQAAGAPGASRDDRVFITLRHANGSISSISYQSRGDAAVGERIEVFGGGRSAIIDGWDSIELWCGGKRQRRSGGKDKGHAAGFAAFVEGCKSGRWPVPWAELHAVTAATLGAVESLRSGATVDIEPR